MLKAVDKVLNPTIFKILILIITLVMQVPFIHSAFGGYVKYVLAFGILIILFELATGKLKGILKNKANILAFAFAGFYAVSIVLNRGSNFGANIKQLLYMIVFFILLFFVEKIDIKATSVTIVVFTFIISAICLTTYVLNIYEWYIIGAYLYVGKVGTTLWGLYNPNTCGAIATVSIITSLYLIFGNEIKKVWLKVISIVLLVVNLLVQYLVLLFSSSRGAYYGLLIAIAILIFVFVIKNFKREKINTFLRIVIALVLCIGISFGILKVSSFIQMNKDKICVVSDEDAVNIEKDTNFENDIEELLKKYTEDSSAFSGIISLKSLSITSDLSDATGRTSDITNTTGRDIIWKSGFKAFLDKPIFGWTREGLVEPTVNNIIEATGYDSGAVSGGGLHNLYLTILTSSGIVGFIVMAALAILVLIRFLKQFFKKAPMSKELLFSFTMCMYFFVSELVENRILYQVTFFNVVFWIFFGYLNFYSLKGNKKSEKES